MPPFSLPAIPGVLYRIICKGRSIDLPFRIDRTACLRDTLDTNLFAVFRIKKSLHKMYDEIFLPRNTFFHKVCSIATALVVCICVRP